MPGWSMDDLSCTRLPEKRLSKRLDKLVSALAAMPQASVPQACGKAGAKAAYRFWANRRMTPQALREAQVQATVQRIWQRQADGGPLEVEVIQDTTSLDFTSLKKTPGLGPLENRHCQAAGAYSSGGGGGRAAGGDPAADVGPPAVAAGQTAPSPPIAHRAERKLSLDHHAERLAAEAEKVTSIIVLSEAEKVTSIIVLSRGP